MSDDRVSDVGLDEAPEVLALRAEVARVRDSVIPTMRAKQERTNVLLGGRRRRRISSPYGAAIAQMGSVATTPDRSK
jgi:hypothetical protein